MVRKGGCILYRKLNSKMKYFVLVVSFFILKSAWSQCPTAVDILVVGDSQTGATWSKSYFGNFLSSCLEGNFVVYGRGGTVPANWLGTGGMDQIETMQRTPTNRHLNLGANDSVPLCKRRIGPMLDEHQPKKILFQFGGNMISQTDEEIKKQIDRLMITVTEKGIRREDCYFLTPTYEMAVATNRNVPRRNLQAVLRINDLISQAINDRCQILNGVELMKDSAYFDGKELLKRVMIEGLPGCGGAAVNDNVHVCGEAARDMAKKVCDYLN